MRRCFPILPLSGLLFLLPVECPAKKLGTDERIEIMRGLTAEYATAKVMLPRSKKPLIFESTGTWDKKQWDDVGKELGPAARTGDLIQVTKVTIESDKILLEINGGMKGGRKWYERIEVGMGTQTTPVGSGNSNAPGGTNLSVVFPKEVPAIAATDIKKMLAPILDFEKRSATEQYVENLPAPVQAAIKEKRAIEGMDKEQVVMALGRPRSKTRETKDGVDLEDWIYGTPPGKITFVTFNGSKVTKVRETYAGLGGSVADPLPPR
jgi:hypothetical protein